jgi:hypothetical protein
LRELALGNKKDRAIRDLAITAFWGIARLAELTYGNKEGPLSRPEALLTTDVQFTKGKETETAWLTLRNAKTCGPGKTQHIQLKEVPNQLCPVAAVKQRLQEAGGTATSLFGYYQEKPRKRQHLTHTKVVTHLQKVWKKGGYKGITGHSF